MEQLKVKKKDAIVRNSIVFLVLAFCFLCLQHAYRNHISPFSLHYLKQSAELFWYVALPIGVASLCIWTHHRMALSFYIASVSLVGLKVAQGLFTQFNKLIVITLFFYIVISYFLYQLLKYYYKLASINPNFSTHDLFDPLLRLIPCQVEDNGETQEGFLTNWDEEGCFIKLNSLKNFSSKIRIKVVFQGREFFQEGEVVAYSIELSGVGIKFMKIAKDMNVFNWAEFSELIDEMGFQPQRLR